MLWRAVERVIPDIRRRAEVSFVGTPLTQERFVRRARGTYGEASRLRAKSGRLGKQRLLYEDRC